MDVVVLVRQGFHLLLMTAAIVVHVVVDKGVVIIVIGSRLTNHHGSLQEGEKMDCVECHGRWLSSRRCCRLSVPVQPET